MDPVMAKLNAMIQEKVTQSGGVTAPSLKPLSPESGPDFHQTLADKLLEKVQGDMGVSQGQPRALSADEIHIKDKNLEVVFGTDRAGEPLGEKFFSTFSEMNKDLNSVDAAIEILSMPDVKITLPMALSLQAGIAKTTIFAEGFSRFVDGVGRGIQTITSTQV